MRTLIRHLGMDLQLIIQRLNRATEGIDPIGPEEHKLIKLRYEKISMDLQSLNLMHKKGLSLFDPENLSNF